MEPSKVEQWLMMNSAKLPPNSIPMLREKLLDCSDDNIMNTVAFQMKDPTISLVLSILVGHFGVDRFYIGDTGMGLGKLFTCGGAYIWWLIDIFMIMDATREKNLYLVMGHLN